MCICGASRWHRRHCVAMCRMNVLLSGAGSPGAVQQGQPARDPEIRGEMVSFVGNESGGRRNPPKARCKEQTVGINAAASRTNTQLVRGEAASEGCSVALDCNRHPPRGVSRLRWQNIDERWAILKITEAFYRGDLGTPKTEASVREVALDSTALRLLREWKAQSKRRAPTDLVFGAPELSAGQP